MKTNDPNWRERVDEIFAQAPFIAHLGMELVDLGPGWCETALAVRPEHLQQNGFVHAGVQATMADHTAGAACGTLLPSDHIVLTVEFKLNLLRPCVGERLTCRASVLKPGSQIAVAESEVFAGDKLTAKATVTCMLRAP